MVGPYGRSVLLRLATVWGLALCVGCRKSHPLRDDFSRAVLAREPVALDMPGTGDEEAVRRFVSKHGRDAVALYRIIITEMRHPSDYTEGRELIAAVEGMLRVEGASALPLLRELVVDMDVPFSVLEQGIVVLRPDVQSEVLGALRTRFQQEEEERARRRIVGFMSRMANPAAIPVLRELL